MRGTALLLITMFLMSCGGGQRAAVPGGSGTTNPGTPGTPVTPPRDPQPPAPGGPTGFNWPTGATTNLVVPDVSILEQYTGRPMNFPAGAPVTIKFNVDVRNVSPSTDEIY